jgi:hypothetical protein
MFFLALLSELQLRLIEVCYAVLARAPEPVDYYSLYMVTAMSGTSLLEI